MGDNRPIKEILLENGFIVTDKKHKSCVASRMITDLEGNELGYYHALKVLDKLVYSNK